MVQVIKTGNRPGELTEMLGMSLGQGLGKGLDTFFANRALDSVLNDKSLEDVPPSQKLEAVRKELSRYESGAEIFQQLMKIDEKEQQEKQKKLDLKKGDVFRRRLAGEKISDKEKELFTPQEELAIANHQQAIELQNLKDQSLRNQFDQKNTETQEQRKFDTEKQENLFRHQNELQTQKDLAAHERSLNTAPLGGISNQPVPADQIDTIERFMKNNPKATADELAIGLGKSGVYPIYSNPYIENRRREEENSTKEKSSESKIANSNDIRFHEESKEYANRVSHDAKIAKERLSTIAPIIADVKNGKIKPTSIANIFRFFGPTGNKLADAVLTGKEANLLAAIPEFLEGRKELFGVRLSDADLAIISDKLPDIGKSQEANLKILNLMKKYAEKSLLRQEASEKVLQEKGIITNSGNLRPLNFENLVEREFDKLSDEEENGILMRLPDGREKWIQRKFINDAEDKGFVRIKI